MAWIENYEIPYSSLERFSVHGLSDFQIGSSSCNIDLVKRTIDKISRDKNGIVVVLGDIEDDDRPTTRAKRRQAFAEREEVIASDAKKHRAWINQEVLPILKPLATMKHKVAGVLAGHHWTQLEATVNSVEYICSALSTYRKDGNIAYLGEMSAWIRLKFIGQGKYKGMDFTKMLHIQHGVGGGQTLASALNRLEKTSHGFPADAYIRAHDCKLVSGKITEVFPLVDSDKVELHCKDVALLNIGAATRGYNLTKGSPDYVESGMMNPVTLGWGSLHFDLRESYPWESEERGIDADIRIEI